MRKTMQSSESPEKRSVRPALTGVALLLVLAFVIWRVASGRIPVVPFLALAGAALVLGPLIGLLLRRMRSRS